jgi:hypothetical protein
LYHISSAAGVGGVVIAIQKAFNHGSASNTNFNRFFKRTPQPTDDETLGNNANTESKEAQQQ